MSEFGAMVKKDRKFFLCYFETTRQCDQHCTYCMTRASVPTEAKELSTEEVKHLVLDEVKKICPQGLVAFSGGEFLLREDALPLLQYCSQLGLFSFINTNGKCLDRALIKTIKRTARGRIIFGFSLDSIDGQAQEKTRRNKPDEILALARMCDREHIGYFFLLTITKLNLATLTQTMEFLKAHNIPMIRSPFVPRGAGKAMGQIAFDCNDMQEFIHPALRNNPLSYVSYVPFFASPEHLKKTWEHLEIPIANLGCQAARGFIGISAEGKVAPCVHLLDTDLNCGNVREKPLSELLETDAILTSLADGSQVKGKCGRCRYMHSCRGCRALAYYATGDHLEADPTCFFEPLDTSTRSEFEEMQGRNVSRFIRFIALHAPWNKIFRPASLRARLRILLWALTNLDTRSGAKK
jgi:AdoMet-dependent heme synthase